jgi:hypothetical protein
LNLTGYRSQILADAYRYEKARRELAARQMDELIPIVMQIPGTTSLVIRHAKERSEL